MKISIRSAAGIIGSGILGGAIVVLILSADWRNAGRAAAPGARPGQPGEVDEASGASGGAAATATEEETARGTKSHDRPSAAELNRQRLERKRMEAVERLGQLKGAGLGGQHPSVVKAADDLKKIEAEQSAAGGVDMPSH